MADALATLSSMYKVNFHNGEPQITIRHLDRPAHVFAVEESTDEKPWYFDIKHFLQTQEYRTSVRTSTGATPFSFVYGMEAVLPIEVEIPSMRVLMEAKLTEAEWCQSRFDDLKLIEEKRMTALCHGQLYQQRMKKAFDKKVRPRTIKEGDLVLKKIQSFLTDSRGKWTPNYDGPYVVKRAFSGGALILTTMDGEEFTRPVNVDAVKKYFA